MSKYYWIALAVCSFLFGMVSAAVAKATGLDWPLSILLVVIWSIFFPPLLRKIIK
jgi:hypothetical protein